ncbi:MAG: glycosyltransferase [Microvirga sp.]
MKVLIAVTHLLGAGHLTRAAALARAFARAGHPTTLVSGGMPAPLVSLGEAALVQLPPVRTAGTDFSTLLDEAGARVGADRLNLRKCMLLDAFRSVRPDVVVTELFPFGRRVLAGEFMALVDAARAVAPRPLIVASVRDILACPAKSERIEEAHRRLGVLYDAVLVHGDPNLVRLERSWPLSREAAALVRYTGYVDEGGAAVAEPTTAKRGEILVSGGSSAASLPLYRAALAAAASVSERPWRVVVGAGVAQPAFEDLRRTAPAHVAVERARPDFRALLARAAVSVSQAGYNTAVDLLRAGVAAVLVPFEAGHETEQRLRAECLAALGLARLLPEAELAPATLAERVRIQLTGGAPPRPEIRLDGAERSIALVEELARRPPHPAVAPPRADWSPLDDVLRRTAGEGRTVAIWWRDDDAVAATPALDRLLEVARAFDLPIALAAIPRGVERSLMERLGDEPQAHIVVHGLAHLNHAPPGEKKAEFGRHRPLAALARDAEAGLRLAGTACRTKLLPVFVPPWNRTAPELLPLLSGLGYRGFSSFGDRRIGEPAPGLRQINTHIDPIDWTGSRGLLAEEAIVARLAAAIAARLDGDADADEPIGLLTHHLIHDEGVWRFCETLLDRLKRHEHLSYPSPRTLFP